MNRIDTSLAKLYARRSFGIKPGLAIEESLLEMMGNPERSFATVHVSGTNGKGSVSAVVESILRAAGCRTGLYTSPHLLRFNERIRVGADCIADCDLSTLIDDVEHVSMTVAREHGQEPTFFECATAMAFAHFRNAGVNVVVLETGMGGRLDATNVVMPAVSVITRVNMEHMKYLGTDLESIAREKAGIIKDGRPVVVGGQDEIVKEVILQVAKERSCTVVDASDAVSVIHVSQELKGQKVRLQSQQTSYGTMVLPLHGRHQLENLATAVAAAELFCDIVGCPLNESIMRRGVESVVWPGRFQVVAEDPVVVLDGAHNPCAAAALADVLKDVLAGQHVGMVMGMCDDKDAEGTVLALSRVATRVWTVTIDNERSLGGDALAGLWRRKGIRAECTSLDEALIAARKWACESGGAVCVTGSLFLVGEAMVLLGAGEDI